MCQKMVHNRLILTLVLIHVLFVCVPVSGGHQVSRTRRNDPPPVSLCPQICECTEHKASASSPAKTAGDLAVSDQLESPANKSAAVNKGSSEILKNGIRVKCQSSTILRTVQKLDLPHLLVENTVQLDLSSNSFSRLGADDFSSGSYSMLQKLVVRNNQISEVAVKALQPLEHLKYLDVSNNKLTKLLPEAIAGLSSLERVKLNGNPIRCDCSLGGLLLKAAAMNVKLQGTCQDPAWLKDRQLSRLTVQDLSCGAASKSSKDASLSASVSVELKPSTNQIVFEGDPFKLVCSITSSSSSGDSLLRVSWQHQTSSNETSRYVDATSSRQRVNETRSDLGDDDGVTIDSWLQISHLEKINDDGWWSCSAVTTSSAAAAVTSATTTTTSKSVQVTVLSINTPTCPGEVTLSNKGRFVWPRTMAGLKIQLPCPANGHVSATRACGSTGQWTDTGDVTLCAFVNEVTKVLEQFAKTNLVNSSNNNNNIITRFKKKDLYYGL